jgi:prepilin signal peptidase PulO-like enzyme (type II secretory pathway)
MSSRSWFLKSVLWLLAVFVFLLLFVIPILLPVILNSGYPIAGGIEKHLATIQWLQLKSLHFFTYVWIFFLGSCFASFLNVVAWRVPRGRSILGSSHCPHCNLKLSFVRDNVPIVGWLRNEGKCSNCRAPISVRYLVAELMLGMAFLTLFIRELTSGGANLPFRSIDRHAGIINVLFYPNWNLIALFAFHLTLLAALFTFTMIASEKRKVPFSIFGFASVAGLSFLFIHRGVNLVGWRLVSIGESNRYVGNVSDQIISILVGLAVGVAAGAMLSFSVRQRDRAIDYESNSGINPVYASLMLAGIFLGWQTVVSIVAFYFLVSLCIYFAVLFDHRYQFANASGRIFLATLLHLLFWRQQDTLLYWSSPSASTIGTTVCVGGAIVCAVVFSLFAGYLEKVDTDSVSV